MGFRAIDRIADDLGIKVNRGRFSSLVGEGMLDGEKILLLKPQTFMNLSGRAIREAVSFYKIDGEDLTVIYDDIDIPLGSIRIRKSGGPGTHNGMRSVVSELGTRDFSRIRIGIGGGSGSLVDYVIGPVPAEENARLDEAAEAAATAAEDIVRYGIDRAMNMDNTGKKKADEN